MRCAHVCASCLPACIPCALHCAETRPAVLNTSTILSGLSEHPLAIYPNPAEIARLQRFIAPHCKLLDIMEAGCCSIYPCQNWFAQDEV